MAARASLKNKAKKIIAREIPEYIFNPPLDFKSKYKAKKMLNSK
ncbi:unnamed protein product [marine sediment metagenome]|uniref:Uncharacterized protein n=1 Tax=marine sediment metagenome TaxID=412755 RepID=X1J643_9ZZZZ